MRFLFSALLLALSSVAFAGCSPGPKTKSEQDVSVGTEKIEDVENLQKREDVSAEDYSKMTQVDPNLKQEAMTRLDKAVEADPKNPDAYYERGFAELSRGDDLLKAVNDFSKAIELKPDYARAYLMRGRAYEALGERDKAKADRQKALELQPGID